MGMKTTASGDWSTAMGKNIEAKEDNSLAVSGNVYAADFRQQADARLAGAVSHADSSRMLQALQVVEHGRSHNCCTHLNRTSAQCAAERTVGLIAQQVAMVEPRAVSSGTAHDQGLVQAVGDRTTQALHGRARYGVDGRTW